MAKAIDQIEKVDPSSTEQQIASITEILQALTDNKQAILDLLAILGYLQEMGALEALRGLLSQRENVGAVAIKQLNQPGVHNMMKNAMTLLQVAGTIQPEGLQRLSQGLSKGFAALGESQTGGNSLGLWDIMKTMREPEVRSSMGMLVGFLRGMGEASEEPSSNLH